MSDSSPQVIIIAGPNGAGKSTLAPLLLKDTLTVMEYVNSDTIALGLSAFQPEAAAFEAGRVTLKRLRNLAKQHHHFSFETTLATRSYAPWIQGLSQEGFKLHLIFLWLRTPELAIQRVKERVRLGGHNIPETIIHRRYQRGIKNFFTLYSPIVESWGIYDNSSNSPGLIATAYQNGDPVVLQNDLWIQLRNQYENFSNS